MNIGIIGTGNMGKILIEAFIESLAVPPSKITIMNRSMEKAEEIKKFHPEINIATCCEDVVKTANIIFICIKPLEIHPLLQQLTAVLSKEQCIVSITSPIQVQQIEAVVNCQVARVIPSITNRALSGVSLITFGESCQTGYREYIESLFSCISTPIQIEDNVTRVASDIVSCGPAFLSFLLQRFVKAAVSQTTISKDQATLLVSEMLIGMGKLIEKELFTLPSLQEKVSVKGGITGEGINVLEEHLGDVFERLFKRTHEKYYEDIALVHEQFEKKDY